MQTKLLYTSSFSYNLRYDDNEKCNVKENYNIL